MGIDRSDTTRYQRIWRNLRFLCGGALCRIFAYERALVPDVPAPYLVVCNHNTDLDPALVGLCFEKQMFFVASEHVFRKGLGSKLLISLFAPISRIKGATDASAALDIIRVLRRGANVCLFAEGNRSFNGVTGPIFPATGKLAKASGASLITFRFEGGYLTTPRWAYTRRRGRMRGRLVHVYSPEQLKGMTPDEVNEAIRADLYEDAFERQATEQVDFVGKRLAEGLENALFLCPNCGKTGTLAGRGDDFVCSSCGLSATYTVRGNFAEGAPFANVRDWNAWQEQKLCALAQSGSADALLQDDGMRLVAIEDDHRQREVARGALAMSKVRMTLGDASFALSEISDMAQVGASKIVFSVSGAHYEIQSDAPHYCGRKYHMLYKIMKP